MSEPVSRPKLLIKGVQTFYIYDLTNSIVCFRHGLRSIAPQPTLQENEGEEQKIGNGRIGKRGGGESKVNKPHPTP